MSWSVHAMLAQVENLEPGQRDRMREIFKPQGNGPVAQSRNFVYVICHLLRGLPPSTVSVLLAREKNEIIPESAVRDYALAYIPPDLLAPHLMLKYFQQMNGMSEVDTLDVLRKIALARLMAMLDQTSDNPYRLENEEGVVVLSAPVGEIRKTIDAIRKLCETSLKAKVVSGAVKLPTQEVSVSVKQSNMEDSDDAPIDPRVASFALQALAELGITPRTKEPA